MDFDDVGMMSMGKMKDAMIANGTVLAYNGSRTFRVYWFNTPGMMKDGIKKDGSEAKMAKVKIVDKNGPNEMWAHINKEQVEQKFGGSAQNVATDFFPPKVNSDQFWLENQNDSTRLMS